ncbi:hypothetical protein SMICM17S_04550 [Streptomyces microflavus]
MSTERPDNDVTGPRRRRPPLAVASVAAAVLLAGGGGAYWASTASGDGGAADSSAARGKAPVLALDAAEAGPATPGDPSTPPPGIAPGEPDPNGPPVVYRAAGQLPDGPDEAAVHRATGTVARRRSPGWRRRSAFRGPRAPRAPPGWSATRTGPARS